MNACTANLSGDSLLFHASKNKCRSD